MTPAEMKAAGAQFLEMAMNQGNVAVIDQFMAPTFVDHSPYPGAAPTADGMKGSITQFRTAVPNLHYMLDDEIVEGDTLVHYLTGKGTMTGPLMGMQPTGKSATWHEVHIVKLQGNQITDAWSVVDQLGMLVQFGLIPAPGGAPVPA